MCDRNDHCGPIHSDLATVERSRYLTQAKIHEQSLIDAVSSPAHGAVATFAGCVRDTEDGLKIRSIVYEAYAPMADKAIGDILARARERWGVAAEAMHRIGEVPVGEAAVFVACGCGHRPEAFEACRFVIDEIKNKAPIWKVRWNP